MTSTPSHPHEVLVEPAKHDVAHVRRFFVAGLEELDAQVLGPAMLLVERQQVVADALDAVGLTLRR